MLFVTGAGTDIGKTYVTALLVRQLCAAGLDPEPLKPVLSGFDPARAEASDAGLLLAAAGRAVTAAALDRVSPWRFAAALSPDMAAAREGRDVPFDAVIAHCRAVAREAAGPAIVEGVGGAMAPIDATRTVADWMAALSAPALLVAGSYLGAISHCLTAHAAMRAAGVAVRAIIVSESIESPVPPEETAAAIARFTGCDVRIVERGGAGPDLTDLAR